MPLGSFCAKCRDTSLQTNDLPSILESLIGVSQLELSLNEQLEYDCAVTRLMTQLISFLDTVPNIGDHPWLILQEIAYQARDRTIVTVTSDMTVSLDWRKLNECMVLCLQRIEPRYLSDCGLYPKIPPNPPLKKGGDKFTPGVDKSDLSFTSGGTGQKAENSFSMEIVPVLTDSEQPEIQYASYMAVLRLLYGLDSAMLTGMLSVLCAAEAYHPHSLWGDGTPDHPLYSGQTISPSQLTHLLRNMYSDQQSARASKKILSPRFLIFLQGIFSHLLSMSYSDSEWSLYIKRDYNPTTNQRLSTSSLSEAWDYYQKILVLPQYVEVLCEYFLPRRPVLEAAHTVSAALSQIHKSFPYWCKGDSRAAPILNQQLHALACVVHNIQNGCLIVDGECAVFLTHFIEYLTFSVKKALFSHHAEIFLKHCFAIWRFLESSVRRVLWMKWSEEYAEFFNASYGNLGGIPFISYMLITHENEIYYQEFLSVSTSMVLHTMQLCVNGVYQKISSTHKMYGFLYDSAHSVYEFMPVELRDVYQKWGSYIASNPETPFLQPVEALMFYFLQTEYAFCKIFISIWCAKHFEKMCSENIVPFGKDDYDITSENVTNISRNLSTVSCVSDNERYRAVMRRLLNKVRVFHAGNSHNRALLSILLHMGYIDPKDSDKFIRIFCHILSDSQPFIFEYETSQYLFYEKYNEILRYLSKHSVSPENLLYVYSHFAKYCEDALWEDQPYMRHCVMEEWMMNQLSLLFHYVREHEEVQVSLDVLILWYGLIAFSERTYCREPHARKAHSVLKKTVDPRAISFPEYTAYHIKYLWKQYRIIMNFPVHAELLERHFNPGTFDARLCNTQLINTVRQESSVSIHKRFQSEQPDFLSAYRDYLVSAQSASCDLHVLLRQIQSLNQYLNKPRFLVRDKMCLDSLSLSEAVTPLIHILQNNQSILENSSAMSTILLFVQHGLSLHLCRLKLCSYTIPDTDITVSDPSAHGQRLRKLSEAYQANMLPGFKSGMNSEQMIQCIDVILKSSVQTPFLHLFSRARLPYSAHVLQTARLLEEARLQYQAIQKSVSNKNLESDLQSFLCMNSVLKDYFQQTDSIFLEVWEQYQVWCQNYMRLHPDLFATITPWTDLAYIHENGSSKSMI